MSGHAKNNKKKLAMGLVMMAVFTAVLILMFLPVFGGGNNGLNYMDNLYNSISKASAYYIPDVQKEAEKFQGKELAISISFADNPKLALPAEKMAASAALLLTGAGATAQVHGAEVKVSGGFGKILTSALADADAMFHNQGDKISQRYGGAEARAMLYTWWQTLAGLQKSLNRQKLFAEASFADRVNKKALETAYNYYGIEPQNIGDKWGIVLFSLIFYVIYTVWYGYAVMFLFEGTGFQLEAH